MPGTTRRPREPGGVCSPETTRSYLCAARGDIIAAFISASLTYGITYSYRQLAGRRRYADEVWPQNGPKNTTWEWIECPALVYVLAALLPEDFVFDPPGAAETARRFRTSCRAASIAGFAARYCRHWSLARLRKDVRWKGPWKGPRFRDQKATYLVRCTNSTI